MVPFFAACVWLRRTVYSNLVNSTLTMNPWHALRRSVICWASANLTSLECFWLSLSIIARSQELKEWLCVEESRRKCLNWRNARGYLGISASAQMLAVFHRTELTNDYPPHFLKHFSSSSLDWKPFKVLAVKLLSFCVLALFAKL